LRISDYLLNDEPCNDDFIDRFDGYELSWPWRGQPDSNAEFGLLRPPPVIFIINTASESLLKFSMSYFLTPLQYRMYKCITYYHTQFSKEQNQANHMCAQEVHTYVKMKKYQK
jgi:hypothetical protein